MNLLTICNVETSKVEAVLGIDEDDISFLSNNDDLDNVLNYLINKDNIFLLHNKIEQSFKTLSVNKINTYDKNYLIGINYMLPYPWRILGLLNVDDNNSLSDNIMKFYKLLEKEEFLYD